MDKASKLILSAIAAGLWANAAVTLLHSGPAAAQEGQGGFMASEISIIATQVGDIANGSCTNSKIC